MDHPSAGSKKGQPVSFLDSILASSTNTPLPFWQELLCLSAPLVTKSGLATAGYTASLEPANRELRIVVHTSLNTLKLCIGSLGEDWSRGTAATLLGAGDLVVMVASYERKANSVTANYLGNLTCYLIISSTTNCWRFSISPPKFG